MLEIHVDPQSSLVLATSIHDAMGVDNAAATVSLKQAAMDFIPSFGCGEPCCSANLWD
jgi:hypothetical protein